MTLSSEQLSRYLEELRRDTKNREYVAVMPESVALGFRHFAWVSENYCEAKPRQYPEAADILAVAVENLGIRRLVTKFSVASQERKILFGRIPQSEFVRELTVPPRRGPYPLVVGDMVKLHLEPTVAVPNEVLGVTASTRLGDEYLFSDGCDIVLRFDVDVPA